MSVAASAPGKIVLSGEYAVLWDAPAICMAVNRRAVATVSPSDDGECHLVTPGFEGMDRYRVLDALPEMSIGGSELREKITIDVPESLQLMYIGVRASDPEMAATLANTVVQVGLQRYGELQAQSTANTRQFIEQELQVPTTRAD